MITPLRRTHFRGSSRLVLICAFLLSAAAYSNAEVWAADGWMFRRSYYSHEVPAEVQAQLPLPESRSAYRPAVTGFGPGFAIRGGYRINRIFLQSGQSTDLTVIRQGWFDVRP